MKNNTPKQVTNTLSLLEQLATDASLQDETSILTAVTQADIAASSKNSITENDGHALAENLQLDTHITCIGVHPGEEDDEEDEEEEQQPGQEENLLAVANS